MVIAVFCFTKFYQMVKKMSWKKAWNQLNFLFFLLTASGHNYLGERYMPVLLKDVAGLVPGAWEGKGRGNR